MSRDFKTRILLVKLSSFGDVIHALPTLEALRALYPQGHITWLVEDSFAALLAGHPALDEVWPIPRLRFSRQMLGREAAALAGTARRLRSRPFDVVVDLQGLLKSAIWVALARSPRRIGFDGTREGSYLVLTEKLPRYDPDRHAVLRYLDAARYLGAPEAAPRFRLEHLLTGRGNPLGEKPARPYVVLHPGARWATKLWPATSWARLAEWLAKQDLAVVLTGSLADRPLAAAVAGASQASVIDLAGRTTLSELAAVLRGAALAVTTDTGPMHLAAALGTPVAALFGPTAPWRTGPFGEGHETVRLGLDCSPCFRRHCPNPRCLTELPVEMVMAACEKMLLSCRDTPVNIQILPGR
ncbi:MAG: lipopolysaccharide heptosyltransferase I [Deltaproteobacteria bacterium]|nr:lipopolysaccharide heptosyltransferase I [Deltaproteobacteria bacterium]